MKVELMKQNKNTPVVRVASAALAAFVLFFSLCVPSFAYSSVSTNGKDFTDQPLSVCSTGAQVVSTGLSFGKSSVNNNYFWVASAVDGVYCFGVRSSSTYIELFFASDSSISGNACYASSSSSDGTNASYYTIPRNSTNASYNLNYGSRNQATLISNSECPVPMFTDSSAGLAAVRDWIDNPPTSASHSLSTSLPAGNAIIIDISGNSGDVLSLSTTSALRHKSPWSDGNQSMNYTDTAPSSISTPYGSIISWSGSGNPNLFGGFNTWVLNGPLNPSKSYLVIVNPAYPNDNPDSITSNQASNGPIHISCAYCKGYTFVPLSSYWNNGSISNESGSVRLDGEYDESTQSWVTTNPATGEPQNPVSGGMTDVDAEHITINDWLQNISHQIGSFFSGAIGAVSNLVGAGSDFINSLSSLYSWLPGPVYAVLSSALILVITIGVIKVFI